MHIYHFLTKKTQKEWDIYPLVSWVGNYSAGYLSSIFWSKSFFSILLKYHLELSAFAVNILTFCFAEKAARPETEKRARTKEGWCGGSKNQIKTSSDGDVQQLEADSKTSSSDTIISEVIVRRKTASSCWSIATVECESPPLIIRGSWYFHQLYLCILLSGLIKGQTWGGMKAPSHVLYPSERSK